MTEPAVDDDIAEHPGNCCCRACLDVAAAEYEYDTALSAAGDDDFERDDLNDSDDWECAP